ncbi:MAG: flavin reductase family protein [Spirochaetaceae bacterium]|nr:flavin reductase family protein [Spirochaetaceae bacterium]
MEYKEYALGDAYELQNAGGIVLICTRANDGRFDLAPVAWCCPMDYDGASKFLCVLDTGHKTYSDIIETREFAIALPTAQQLDLIKKCGSKSGFMTDKYGEFGIESFPGRKISIKLPVEVAGWIECKMISVNPVGTSGVITGETLGAWAAPDFWKMRVHFVTGNTYFSPGEKL